MDLKLDVQHEVDTCIALAAAVGALLAEAIDAGGNGAQVHHAQIVLGTMQDRLVAVKALADRAVIDAVQDS